MKILFRVDANSKIGMGHLQRCLSLARAFVLQKCDVTFLIKEYQRANERVAQFGFEVCNLELDLSLGEDLQATLTFLLNGDFQIVVADSYEFDENYLLTLRQANYCVVFIDDLAQMVVPCHFVINGAIYAKELDYRSSTGDTKFLLGPKYMLLREEFWDIPERKIKPEVGRILVTVGGFDSYNVTPTILDTLSAINRDFDVDVIVGPFFNNVSEIKSAAAQFGKGRVQLIDSPTSVRNLMLDCDLAISGGGQTLYELAALGTPTIALKLADNQENNIHYMNKAGVIETIKFEMDSFWQRCLSEKVSSLSNSLEYREKASYLGQRLVDGRGAVRVARAIGESFL